MSEERLPLWKVCPCGITSIQFCNSWSDKPFSLCQKIVEEDKDEKASNKK